MDTPVSFSTAKLAIQKGFDKECKEYWNLIEYSSEWIVEHRINPDSVDFMYAPTIAEVIMWLYEKHKIWISVDAPHKLLKSWCFEAYKINDEITLIEKSLFNSPTEAYEAAIDYVLNNLNGL